MRHHSPGFSLSLIFLILVSGCLAAESKVSIAKGELPAIKKDCGLCHPTHDGKVTTLLKKPVSELCLDCHPGRKGNGEHVVDVVPAVNPAGLPLHDGKITCATCHDPHSNQYGSLLRMPREKLCRACHRK